jgi:hypothetical protein
MKTPDQNENSLINEVNELRLFAEFKRAEESLRHSQEVLEMNVGERTGDLVKANDEAVAASQAESGGEGKGSKFIFVIPV